MCSCKMTRPASEEDLSELGETVKAIAARVADLEMAALSKRRAGFPHDGGGPRSCEPAVEVTTSLRVVLHQRLIFPSTDDRIIAAALRDQRAACKPLMERIAALEAELAKAKRQTDADAKAAKDLAMLRALESAARTRMLTHAEYEERDKLMGRT